MAVTLMVRTAAAGRFQCKAVVMRFAVVVIGRQLRSAVPFPMSFAAAGRRLFCLLAQLFTMAVSAMFEAMRAMGMVRTGYGFLHLLFHLKSAFRIIHEYVLGFGK